MLKHCYFLGYSNGFQVQTNRAALSMSVSEDIAKASPYTTVDVMVDGDWHAPCTMKTIFVDSEKEQAQFS